MAAVTDHATPATHEDAHDEGHDHPTDLTYWKVGIFLAVLTAIEVSTFWWSPDRDNLDHPNLGIDSRITTASLIIMMTIKFITVLMYFMHLKFDNKILRRVFFAGLILAVSVYLIFLSALLFWNNSGTDKFQYAPRAKVIPPPPTEPPPITKPGHSG